MAHTLEADQVLDADVDSEDNVRAADASDQPSGRSDSAAVISAAGSSTDASASASGDATVTGACGAAQSAHAEASVAQPVPPQDHLSASSVTAGVDYGELGFAPNPNAVTLVRRF